MKKLFTFLAALALSAQFVGATGNEISSSSSSAAKPEFKSAPIVTIFTNYHYGFGSEQANSGYDLDRAYLGYKFSYGNWSGQATLDFGSTGLSNSKLDLVAYIKNASVTYKNNGFKANFGMIKTTNFATQESFWGYRYIGKSYMDENGFAPSADLGMSVSYDFCDWFSADFQMTNGEGYKQVDIDNQYRYTMGMNFKPAKNMIARVSYDIYDENGAYDNKVQQTFSAFVGYKSKQWSLGGEYVRVLHNDFISNANLTGLSFMATKKISKQFNAFARFDYTSSDRNMITDEAGNRLFMGFEWIANKYIKVSPNVQNFSPRFADKSETFAFLNFQIKF